MIKFNSVFSTCVILIINLISCTFVNRKAHLPIQINFINRDTVINADSIFFNSHFKFDYEDLTFVNTFKKDSSFSKSNLSNIFNLNNYDGLSIIYNGKKFNNLISLDCESNDCNKNFAVFNGDSVDNIGGFQPLLKEKDSITYISMPGYFYGCNGLFCDNGSLLVLKFIDKQLVIAFLIALDKSIYQLDNLKGFIADNNHLRLIFNRNSNDSLILDYHTRITIQNKLNKNCSELGLNCIR